MVTPTDSADDLPILEFEDVKLVSSQAQLVMNLVLSRGELAFLRGRSVVQEVLGMSAVDQGVIRVFGKTWDERNVATLEDDRRKIGAVVNPRSKVLASWVTNLDVDENVTLAAEFDRQRSHVEIDKKAEQLAKMFALDDGVPTVRPSKTSPENLIRAQWVRAFLPEPLRLLILENPLINAPPESALLLAQAVKRALADGTSVLWVADAKPVFSELGLEADFLLESF